MVGLGIVCVVLQDHCHYQGYVEDMEGSAVAMSICDGLR